MLALITRIFLISVRMRSDIKKGHLNGGQPVNEIWWLAFVFMWWLAQTRQLQTVSQQSSLVRHQRLPLMAEREGTGRGIVGRQRRGRSAGQLKGPLNPNLYLMSERGEWGNRAGRGRPAPDSKGKERQHLHTQCRTGTARAPLLELGIWLHKADLYCRHGSTSLLEQSSGQFLSQQKDFINSNRLSKTVRKNSSIKSHSLVYLWVHQCWLVQLQILNTYRSLRIVPQVSATMATLDKYGKALSCTLTWSFGSWVWQEA